MRIVNLNISMENSKNQIEFFPINEVITAIAVYHALKPYLMIYMLARENLVYL